MTDPTPPPDPPVRPYTPPPAFPSAPGYPVPAAPGYPVPAAPGYPVPPAPGYPNPAVPGYQDQPAPGYLSQPQPGYAGPVYPDYYGAPMPEQVYPVAPYQYGYLPYGPPQRPTDGMAIASLIVSCMSVLTLCGYGVGGLVGAVGAILGHVARRRIRQSGAQGDGMALAGIIVGWITTTIGLLSIAFLIVFVATNEFGSGS